MNTPQNYLSQEMTALEFMQGINRNISEAIKLFPDNIEMMRGEVFISYETLSEGQRKKLKAILSRKQ